MKRIEIVGLNRERKQLIEYLQRCGAVDISDSREGVLAGRETASTISQLESNMAQVASTIEMLPKDKGESASFLFPIRCVLSICS